MAALLALPGSATAAIGVESFSLSASTAQAGAHPDLNIALSFEDPGEPETAKDAAVVLPEGNFLYPGELPKCTSNQWAAFDCPIDSQVGLVTVRGNYEGDPDFVLGTAPVYLLTAGNIGFGRLGFVVPTIDEPLEASVRSGAKSMYRVYGAIEGLPQTTPIASLAFTLWGVPASPSHDAQRFPSGAPGEPAGCPEATSADCIVGTASSVPQAPFIRNPTGCGQGFAVFLADSYEEPGVPTTTVANGPTIASCGALSFAPQLSIALSTSQISTPSGVDLQVRLPADLTPQEPSGSDLKTMLLSLPSGVRVEEGAGSRLEACSTSQAHLEEESAAQCPAGSKVGVFTATLAGVTDPLDGGIYFASEASNGTYNFFLVGIGGIEVKLPADLTPGGTLELRALPQLPFEELDLEVSVDSGVFVTAPRCAAYEAMAEFVPWSAAGRTSASAEFTLDWNPAGGVCPGPAENLTLSLEPTSITADGSSTTTATVAVTDAGGNPLTGEEIEFSSTDAGQAIGTVVDHGNGTYTATITASTTPGTATISVFDRSAEPQISSTAKLTQTAVNPPPPGESPQPGTSGGSPPSVAAGDTPFPGPIVELRRQPPHRSRDRTPTFRFVSSIAHSTFKCKIDRHPWRSCHSPLTLRKLPFGRHTFRVRSILPSGKESITVTYRFLVVPGRRSA